VIDHLFGALVRTSVEGGLLACAAWTACRLVPSIPVHVRAWLWWLVCARFVIGLAGLPAASLGVLPPEAIPSLNPGGTVTSPARVAPTAPRPGAGTLDSIVAADPWGQNNTRAGAGSSPAPGGPARSLARAATLAKPLVVWGWIAACLVLAGGMVRDIERERRRLSRLRRLEPTDAPGVDRLASQSGLRVVPDVRIASDARSPVAAWVGRPVVIVPERLLQDRARLALALCHEFVHLRRHDVAWGLVPALAERALFFHPLARLAAREYLVNREGACDAEVVARLDASPREYGRLLLAFGLVRRPAAGAVGTAASSHGALERRLVMLQQAQDLTSRWWWAVVAVAVVLAVPVRITARSAEAGALLSFGEAAVSGQVAPPAPPDAPPPPPPPPPPALRLDGNVAPVPPPAPPRPPRPPKAPARHGTSYSYTVDGESWSYRSTSDEGAGFWFTRGGVEYVVRDPGLLARVDALLKPQADLGTQQGQLGERQGALGAQQGALGAKQGALGAKQGALGAKQAALSARMAARAGHRDDEARLKALEAEMDALDEEMEALGQEMEALGSEQEVLGQQQEELGAQQERLAERQQAAQREAAAAVERLKDEALAKGLAKRR
jgi:beta-lactamase regulating signal transducer with metallopeptidase domain